MFQDPQLNASTPPTSKEIKQRPNPERKRFFVFFIIFVVVVVHGVREQLILQKLVSFGRKCEYTAPHC